jgi:hypothetical protein
MERRSPWLTLRRGATAGITGVVAEAAWSRAAIALRGGRSPVFDPERMADRLLARTIGRHPSHRGARACGMAMRLGYGPAWGVVWALVRRLHRPTLRVSTLQLAAVIFGFELAALPRVGATPPLRQWPRLEIVLDAGNAAVFALVASAVLAAMGPARPDGSPRCW